MQVNTDELLSKVQQDIQNAESFYQSQIEPKVKERYQLYNADPDYYAKKFPKLAELNSFTSTDVADQIEWAMPSLMRIFFGGQDVIVVKGRTVEDDKSAEIMQKLINWQIQRQNPGFMIFYRWFKDALITGLGIIKAYWVREFEERKFSQVVGIDEYLAAKDDPAIEILEAKPLENGMIDLTFKVKLLLKNQPILENIPASEFIFNPNAKRIEESPFVAHRKLVTADYLLRRAKDGWYDEQKVKELLEEGDNGASFISSVDPSLMPNKNFMVNQPDDARRNFTLYECYTKYDINGDGLLEDVIVTVVGNKILRVVENIYKRPPFFVLTPILEPYQIWGKGFGDVLKDVQDVKTAIIRQIIVNIGLNNDPKVFVDGSKVDLNDLSSGSSYIRVDGNPQQAIQPFPVRPLAPWTYNFLEYWEGIKENRTGITRYNQGLDARSLNKRIDINTPVPMADGTWKLLRDIKDGDLILGGDGKPAKVIKAHEIAYCDDAYEVEFSNGAKIVADAEHLWGVYVHGRYKVLNTKQIKELFDQGKPIYIPRPERIYSGQKKDLPIDPYVFGVWLGDGHKHSARITVADEEIVERVRAWVESQGWELKEDKHQNSGKAKTYRIISKPERKRNDKGQFVQEDSFHRRLTELGVYPKTGGEPHIPEEYFTASYEQRLELLRGLMDTDGCWGSNGIAIFCTSNKRLAEDVVRLIRSLGGNPHLRKSREAGKTVCVGRVCDTKEHWHVNFNIADCPFFISRKASKWRPPQKNKTYRIVSVKEAEGCLMRCLTVDNPDGLWLVGEQYITTHNTATGIQLIMQAANQRLELIARIFAETGVKDLFRFLVELNQRFIDQATVIRLTNEPLVIRPDDLKGEFDLVIEAGVGVGAKEQMLQNLKEIMSMYPQLMQLGLATPKNLYEVVKRYFQLLGFKAVDKLLTEPQIQQGGQLGILQQAGGENPALAGAVQEDASPRAVLERALEAYQRMQGGPVQGMDGEPEGEVGADIIGTQSPPEMGNSPEQGY